VFFDNAPPGGVRARNLGLVIARFIRQGSTADDAIRQRLNRLGREARNWTVISSDHAVQAAARAVQAQFVSSDVFARTLLKTIDETRSDRGASADLSLSQDEVDDWLELFGGDKGNRRGDIS
jgi:serine/threonine protein kinase HipA of HipAB toxin-antitoxin module